MVDLGLTTKAINAKKFQVFIGSSAGNEWKLVQNATVMLSHPVFREPTTGGTVVTYTGAPDHSISGTMLFTTDEWGTATYGLSALLAVATSGSNQGEVPKNEWAVKFVDIASATTTITFNNAKLSSVNISKSAEGAVKADITVVCPDEPA
tara:strand:+ start:376 stop:825 length:450 start_codon:yes stop_codon:yes gene_type:complete